MHVKNIFLVLVHLGSYQGLLHDVRLVLGAAIQVTHLIVVSYRSMD